MGKYEWFLTRGNKKLGREVFAWSLPAGLTCPGESIECSTRCYAMDGYYNFPSVKDRLAWNWEQSLREDFAPRMIREIHARDLAIVRTHVAGDFYSAEYTRKWEEIIRVCASTRFYAYTRSWNVDEVRPALVRLSRLPNMRLWYSVDRSMPIPRHVPKRVRLAYMQVAPDDAPRGDLIFRTEEVRHTPKLPVLTTCPVEDGVRRNVKPTCSSCKLCFK